MEQPVGTQITSRRNKTQILDLLSEYDKNPGMSVKAFCKFHEISEGSFYSARKRHGSAGNSLQKQPGFIAIPSPRFPGPAGALFAEVNGIKLYQAVPADYLKALVL